MTPKAIPLIVLLALAGCAQAMPGYSPKPVKIEADTSGTLDTGGAYVLSEDERKLDCKKLSGRMQVRILQLRGAKPEQAGSTISRTAQSVTKPLIGGTSHGVDPAADLRRDRAMLTAYNAQLKAKNCQPFDIERELAETDPRQNPRPIPKPAAEKKK